MDLKALKNVYFIGIGGIGMSAIARFLNFQGIKVFGYDKVETALTQKLVAEGMQIHYAERVDLVPADIDLVVYTPAIPDDHLELQHFRTIGLPLFKRAEVLGLISKSKKTIAIAGTHGKTTTSTIVTHLLRTGFVDCSAFLGGIAKNYASNFVNGQGNWVVVEADEFDRSFLHLSPDIAVILSMDADHLDIYGSVESIRETGFKAFANLVKEDGTLFVQYNWADLLSSQTFLTYGYDSGTFRSSNIRVVEEFFVFDYKDEEVNWKDLYFTMPGRHNIENATVAIAIARQLGIDEQAIRAGLKSFQGIKRRFETVFRNQKVAFVDDYAHHPSELKAAIHATRQYFPSRKVTAVFQPHLFSRTQDFSAGFAEALDLVDEAYLLDIYPARELPIPGVTSALIFDQMKLPQKHLIKMENLVDVIERSDLEILLTLGAGDIGAKVHELAQLLEKKYN